jgi:hypothetical protein
VPDPHKEWERWQERAEKAEDEADELARRSAILRCGTALIVALNLRVCNPHLRDRHW